MPYTYDKIHDTTIDFIYDIVGCMIRGNNYQELSGFLLACLSAIKHDFYSAEYKTDLILTLLTATVPVAHHVKIGIRLELKNMLDPELTKGL